MASKPPTAVLDLLNQACQGLEAAGDLELDDVAARRERFLVHAAAARQVALYQFVIAPGAQVAAFNAPGQTRDAHDQLHLIIALTGGAITSHPGGLAVRVPLAAAGRFEALARPLIAAFLVAYAREAA